MKYDRPVWQLMHACADDLPEIFRFSDVQSWFAENFPEVGDSTIRAHLVGLTDGGAQKQMQFRHRAPVFRRVSRGVYSVIPVSERGESPDEPQLEAVDEKTEESPVQAFASTSGAKIDDGLDRRTDPLSVFAPQLSHHTQADDSGDYRPADDYQDEAPYLYTARKRIGVLKRWRESRRARREGPQPSMEQPSAEVDGQSPVGSEDLASEAVLDNASSEAVLDNASSEAVLDNASSEAVLDNASSEAVLNRAGDSDAHRAADAGQVDRGHDTHGGPAASAAAASGESERASRVEITRVDAVLVGTGSDPAVVPVPAKNAFRDRAFLRDRRAAERSGAPWFVITPERGLLQPDEWVSPGDEIDGKYPAVEAGWAKMVAAELATAVGPLNGRTFYVSADETLAAPMTDALTAEGARVLRGPVPVRDAAPQQLASVSDEIKAVVEHLTNPKVAIPAAAARGLTERPGVYAWLVDVEGASVLGESLQLAVAAGPLYVGQAGASDEFGKISANLNDHINLVQLHGAARRSTFRSNLATALAEPLGLRSIDDARLTRWMVDHLSVTVWPTDEVETLAELKSQVLNEVHAPLNSERAGTGVFYERMTALRARLA